MGDVVIVRGTQRGRVERIVEEATRNKGESRALVMVRPYGAGQVLKCGVTDVRRVNSWWNTTEMRAAFAGPRVRRRP